MKKLLTAIVVLSCFTALAGCTGTSDSSSSAASTDAEKAATVAESSAVQAETEATTPDYELTILSTSIGKDYSDKPILIVEYQFTHHTADATSFSLSIDDTAYQNGVECSSTVISDSIDAQQQLNDVKADTPYTLSVGYQLTDTTTPVEIECYKLMDFSEDKVPLLTQTVNLS